MKKRIVLALLLTATIASFGDSMHCVASKRGQHNILETGVAVQEETTNLLSGVSLALFNHINDEIYNSIKIDWSKGWVTTNVNVRSLPTTDSSVYEVLNFNDEIKYVQYDDEWVKIQYGETYAYVNKRYVSDTIANSKTYLVNARNSFKSYMPYTAFSKSSNQYKLQQYAYTGNYGIRMINGRYLVAIGTHFLEDKTNNCIGTYFDIVLKNGEIIPCILGDVKANQHTDQNNMYTTHNGCYTEFIVDTSALDRIAKRDGNISSIEKEEWDSPVDKIIVYDKKTE